MTEPAGSRVTLAELLAVLSLAADLGMGQPMEHVLRQCLISLRLAERMGLDDTEHEVIYYSALIAWVGCHVDAYEQAKWFGDDTVLKTDFRLTDFSTAASRPLFMLRHLGAGRPVAEQTRLGVTFLGEGCRAAAAMLDTKQIGQTRNRPPAAWYRLVSSGSEGHPSQATPQATPSSASLTASLAQNIRVGRPCSAAATATRKATVA